MLIKGNGTRPAPDGTLKPLDIDQGRPMDGPDDYALAFPTQSPLWNRVGKDKRRADLDPVAGRGQRYNVINRNGIRPGSQRG